MHQGQMWNLGYLERYPFWLHFKTGIGKPEARVPAVAHFIILLGIQGQIAIQAAKTLAEVLGPVVQAKATAVAYACHLLPDLYSH